LSATDAELQGFEKTLKGLNAALIRAEDVFYDAGDNATPEQQAAMDTALDAYDLYLNETVQPKRDEKDGLTSDIESYNDTIGASEKLGGLGTAAAAAKTAAEAFRDGSLADKETAKNNASAAVEATTEGTPERAAADKAATKANKNFERAQAEL
jgi:hypothetical protein